MAKKPELASPKVKKPKDLTPRFGIGEWFGKVLTRMDTAERRYYAAEVLKEKKLREKQPCPFQPRKQDAKCTKEGGVCPLRLYSYKADAKTGRAMGEPVGGPQGGLRATRSEEHTSELQSPCNLVCRLLLEKKKKHN